MPSCLRRAAQMACALDAELQVLKVLPGPSWFEILFDRPWQPRDAARAALRSTRLWLARELGEEPPAGKVLVRSGSFVEQVAKHVESLAIELIVVAPSWQRVGSLATALARRTGHNVLVAHDPAPHAGILAATDLGTHDVAVLREAARLGLALKSPLAAVHNIDPLGVLGDETLGPPERALSDWSQASRRERLTQAVRSLPVPTTPIVRAEIDPVSAICDEAARRDVDILVVGLHCRSRLERLLRGSVASRVVQRAARSVMIAPLPAPAFT